jgi:DNA-binding PadR family transcriptional regulator
MYQSGEALQYNLLDLLVDAPSSFAALYGGLVRHSGYSTGIDVSLVLDTLLEMERRGWVTATQMAADGSFHIPTAEERKHALLTYQTWLPKAVLNDLSLDEIGLWYELTAKGRLEWKQWIDAEEHVHPGRWTLDDLSDTQTLIIKAESIGASESALDWWLSQNPAYELVSNGKRTEAVSSFSLRDDTVISNGIKLVCQYQRVT